MGAVAVCLLVVLLKRKSIFHQTQITTLTHAWDTIIPNQQIPDGVPSLNAKSCGLCHTEIYKEWQQSTHAHAWTDEQFQAELSKNKDLFVCKNCHLPVQNQQQKITTGLYDGDYFRPVQKDNPHFDQSLQQEGITCVGCHMQDNIIIGSRTNTAPHPVRIDPDYLSEKRCLSCHDAQGQIAADLVCTFETGQEWLEGPFSKKGKNCISCHMPTVERPSALGSISRKGHRHYFPGSGIPKAKNHQARRLKSLAIDLIKPDSFLIAKPFNIGVDITNKYAGHRVPTGDPERFFLIQIDLFKGGELMESDTSRIGEEWDWYPVAKKKSDNNLAPGESRTFSKTYQLASFEQVHWRIRVTKHRMTSKIHAYHHLSEDYGISITVFDKEIFPDRANMN